MGYLSTIIRYVLSIIVVIIVILLNYVWYSTMEHSFRSGKYALIFIGLGVFAIFYIFTWEKKDDEDKM